MNKMFNFNGMPYKRSGRAGGKSVSMIGMLVLLLAALLVLPSCDDTETVEGPETIICNGEEVADRNAPECQAAEEEDDYLDATGGTADRYSMGSDFDDMLAGDDEADYIDGGRGDDSIKGMGGDDSLKGNGGNDTLYGGDGDDVLDGGAGDDTIDGGAGDDELTGGSGNNTLDGGEGDGDIAIYRDAMQVTVDLRSDKARVQHETPVTGSGYISLEDSADSGTGNDTLTNIENVKGTHTNDRIDGNENANLLKGLDGADIINGHEGDDIIIPNRPMVVADETPMDGADVVDGGAGSDTISYEGEAEAVTVTINLGTVVEAIEEVEADEQGQGAMEGVIAHVAATTSPGNVTDMIKVVDESMEEDEEKLVSTIENLKGGAGGDMLTGDARVNRLYGGGGDDMLDGGAGNDMLMGGAGDDTLMGDAGNDMLMGGAGTNQLDGGAGDDTYVVIVGDAGVITEVADGGDDVVSYVAQDDDDAMPDTDESKIGLGISGTTHRTAPEVEITRGTPNADYIEAHTAGAAILGREGNDTLTGGDGEDTLVGCDGKNTLNGGAKDDIFGVFKPSTNDGTNADTIEGFTTGDADDATTDEIHLKGFEAGAEATADLIPGNATHAGVLVDGVLVAIVASVDIMAVMAQPEETPPVVGKTKVEAIRDALRKSGAVVFDHEFAPAKCSSE